MDYTKKDVYCNLIKWSSFKITIVIINHIYLGFPSLHNLDLIINPFDAATKLDYCVAWRHSCSSFIFPNWNRHLIRITTFDRPIPGSIQIQFIKTENQPVFDRIVVTQQARSHQVITHFARASVAWRWSYRQIHNQLDRNPHGFVYGAEFIVSLSRCWAKWHPIIYRKLSQQEFLNQMHF